MALRIDTDPCNDTITDLLAAFLGDVGYESFTPDSNGLTAYIQAELYKLEDVEEIIRDFPIPVDFKFSVEEIEGKDWNEEWEKKYFQPIVIDDKVVVHSSFHKNIPSLYYDIVIDPKMAFGTGHHSTTSQMIRHILEADMEGKTVIDMGTGTGILAILSKMKGAGKVVGIEIDPFAWENAVENVNLNHVDVEMICGDASKLEDYRNADIFLANINRNIITSDIAHYAGSMKPGGTIYLSGFYESDIPVVIKAALPYGFEFVSSYLDKDWAAIKLVKRN